MSGYRTKLLRRIARALWRDVYQKAKPFDQRRLDIRRAWHSPKALERFIRQFWTRHGRLPTPAETMKA